MNTKLLRTGLFASLILLSIAMGDPISLINSEVHSISEYSTYSPTPDLFQIATTPNGLDFFVDASGAGFGTSPGTISSSLRGSAASNTTQGTIGLNSASFSADFSGKHDANMWSHAQTYGIVNFTATEASSYALSGFSNLLPGEPANRFYFGSGIYDLTTSSWLYLSEQQNWFALNVNYALGGVTGTNNTLIGNAMGSLIAGHDYRWVYSSLSQSYATRAENNYYGSASLQIISESQQLAAVPEPTSMALLGLGSLVLGFRGRKKAKI